MHVGAEDFPRAIGRRDSLIAAACAIFRPARGLWAWACACGATCGLTIRCGICGIEKKLAACGCASGEFKFSILLKYVCKMIVNALKKSLTDVFCIQKFDLFMDKILCNFCQALSFTSP